MTRDEAKYLFSKCKSDFIIDKMYDYFESRTCENCKYLDMDLICTNEDTPCCSEYSGRYDNFNCNKWESIDEK